MAKTIRQIADEIGVSKTAINKKIKNLGLQTDLRKDKNRIVVDEEMEKLIKSAFDEKQSQTRKPKTDKKTDNQNANLDEIIKNKNEYIAELRAEQERLIAEKERLLKIIDDNTQTLLNMQDLLKAEMMLRGQAENRVLLLEEKVALSEKKEGLLKKLKKILDL